MLVLLVFSMSAAYAIYSFYTWHHSYWARKGIPGPPPSFFTGNFKEVMQGVRAPFLVYNDWTKIYGSVYGIYEGILKTLVISDPNLLYEVLVKQFDNFHERKLFIMSGHKDERRKRVHVFEARGMRWKRLRMNINPIFTNNALKKIVGDVSDTAERLMDILREEAKGGNPVNILKGCQTYAMDIMSKMVCGKKTDGMQAQHWIKPARDCFTMTQDRLLFHIANAIPGLQMFWRSIYLWYMSRQPDFALKYMFDEIEKAVNDHIKERDEREALGLPPLEARDLIDAQLDQRQDDDVDSMSDLLADFGTVKISKTLDKEEIIAQCGFFVMAGFESTANFLSTLIYDLSARPEIQHRLREEIDTLCTDELDLSYETINTLKYLDCVIKEGLRMHPFAGGFLGRVCTNKCTIGDIEIDPGTMIQADAIALHRNKDIWGDDADTFKPERFLKNDLQYPEANVILSFGAGPRICPGRRLSILEQKIGLIHILRNFEITRGSATEESLEMHCGLSSGPESVTVYLNERL